MPTDWVRPPPQGALVIIHGAPKFVVVVAFGTLADIALIPSFRSGCTRVLPSQASCYDASSRYDVLPQAKGVFVIPRLRAPLKEWVDKFFEAGLEEREERRERNAVVRKVDQYFGGDLSPDADMRNPQEVNGEMSWVVVSWGVLDFDLGRRDT